MTNSVTLIAKRLSREYSGSALATINSVAAALDLTFNEVREIWVRHYGGFEIGQERIIEFLKLDNPEAIVAYPLIWHPLRQTGFEVSTADALVDLADACFILYVDGMVATYDQTPAWGIYPVKASAPSSSGS